MKVEEFTQALLAQTQRVLLRSGDGLGLTQLALSVAVPGRPFAVYPALQPVRTGPFLRYVWTSQRGGRAGRNCSAAWRPTSPSPTSWTERAR